VKPKRLVDLYNDNDCILIETTRLSHTYIVRIIRDTFVNIFLYLYLLEVHGMYYYRKNYPDNKET
jgi:hypothetical protein